MTMIDARYYLLITSSPIYRITITNLLIEQLSPSTSIKITVMCNDAGVTVAASAIGGGAIQDASRACCWARGTARRPTGGRAIG